MGTEDFTVHVSKATFVIPGMHRFAAAEFQRGWLYFGPFFVSLGLIIFGTALGYEALSFLGKMLCGFTVGLSLIDLSRHLKTPPVKDEEPKHEVKLEQPSLVIPLSKPGPVLTTESQVEIPTLFWEKGGKPPANLPTGPFRLAYKPEDVLSLKSPT